MRLVARAGGGLGGRAIPPGDKSISHRALILAALARGRTEIAGLLEADDVLRTAAAIRAFGAQDRRLSPGRWTVAGEGRLTAPTHIVDCGNSGTAARLLIGAAAGFPINAGFTGDASLRRRPMARVLEPLTEMGARVIESDNGRLPLTLAGGDLRGIRYRLPVASAQVKSAILLAAVNAAGETTEIIEPQRTRDHTERMLAAFGVELIASDDGAGRRLRLVGGQELTATRIHVPADPSAAAFPIAAALIMPGSRLWLDGVLVNPLRIGFIETLREMGADITFENPRDLGGEPVADIVVVASGLNGRAPPPARAPSMIDEFPILAVLAAFAEGETLLTGAAELRVKESDRVALTVAGLKACGVDTEELPDGLVVRGAGAGGVKGGAAIATRGDHRIAMAFLVLGLAAREPVIVDEAEMIATSFPDFAGFMRALGAEIAEA